MAARPGHDAGFFERWMSRLPVPLIPADRAHDYWWDLSMRQIEVSRTMVFDQLRNGRALFEALVADNLNLGRPDRIELIFGRQVRSNTPGVFATRLVTRSVEVPSTPCTSTAACRSTSKTVRVMRIDTVINNPTDLGVLPRPIAGQVPCR